MFGRKIRFKTAANVRAIKLLDIIDEYARESLATVADRKIDDEDPTATTFEKTVIQRGRALQFIRYYDGSELTAQAPSSGAYRLV